MKLFRSISWYSHNVKPAGDYIEHLLIELGRLGLKSQDIERYDRSPHTKSVLSDLMNWLSEHPGAAYAKLVDWRTLDQLVERYAPEALPPELRPVRPDPPTDAPIHSTVVRFPKGGG